MGNVLTYVSWPGLNCTRREGKSGCVHNLVQENRSPIYLPVSRDRVGVYPGVSSGYQKTGM